MPLKYIYLTFSDPELLSLDQYTLKHIRSAISNHHPVSIDLLSSPLPSFLGGGDSSNSTLASTKDLKTGSKLGAGSAITPRSLLKLLMLCSFLCHV
ncbi:hypothetical protein MJO28_012494 [Puccinia striiformis f. sp. tritici]|uniref:Uncharacterized protein n=1 Tax=Puccinia striiformis f. sp. tritici TaxID=168172 RepID=A0ACC0E0D7_9BASI|nr:hypothetical protein MJO28_012494 [Puccinia striiformis f. sp. tritici]